MCEMGWIYLLYRLLWILSNCSIFFEPPSSYKLTTRKQTITTPIYLMVDHHVCFRILTSNHRKNRLNMEMKHIVKYGDSIEYACHVLSRYPHLLGPEITGISQFFVIPIYKYWSSNIWAMTVWFNGWLWGKSPGKHSRWFNEHPMNIPWNIKYHQISMNIPMFPRFVHYLCWLHHVTSPYSPWISVAVNPSAITGPRHSQDDQTKAWLRIPQVPAEAANQRVAAWAGKGVEHWNDWNAEMLSWYSLDWSYDLADFFRMPCWKCLISTSRFVRSLYTATNVVWQAAMSHSPGVVRTIGLWTEGNDHNQNKFHCSHLYYILYIYVILVVLQFRSMWFACDDIWSHQGMSVAALSSTPSRTSSMTLPRFTALRCRFR